MPISTMVTFNRFQFNGGDGRDIYLHYAEAMALAVYFLDAHEAKHREGFLDYAATSTKGGSSRAGQDAGGPARHELRPLARDFLAFLKPRPREAPPVPAACDPGALGLTSPT